MKQLKTACIVLGVLSLLLGVIYPLAVTGIAQICFPFRANGSIIEKSEGRSSNDELPIGSALIGQAFTSARYFHGRPSDCGYDGAGSSSSNLGPSNPALVDLARQRVDSLKRENGLDSLTGIPADLVLSSASGLDPDISVDAALLQIGRVARERSLEPVQVRSLVLRNIEPPFLGMFALARLNVLKLNLALDSISAGK